MENGEGTSSPVLSLQWHQHHNTLVSLLDSLWERQELVDVTLAADGQSLDVHRIVLCACSKYFQDLLTCKTNVDKQTIIFLKDVSYCNLRALVDYMYKGEVRINEDQLDSFLDTAKSLGIRGLMGETKHNEATTPTKKRRRSNSVELPSESEASQPAPAVSRRRSSTSKPFDVKSEPPSQASNHYRQDVGVRESLTQPSSIQSSQELDEEDLDLFQPCDLQNSHMNSLHHHASHQGTSRQPAQELHPPSQGYVDHHIGWGMHNGSIDNHHHAVNNHHVNHPDTEPEPGRHSCPRCGRTYKWKQTLLRHMKYECGVEPQFVCPVCRAPFHHRNVLQRHMNLHSRPK